MSKTYSEKLKDVRWQKKRAFIMMRDDFKCVVCKSSTKTLHVHHTVYFKNTDPWDYNDDLLVSLCFECHEKEHGIAKKVVDLERRYEHLIPKAEEEPDVITSINSQISQLTKKLSDDTLSSDLQDEIIRNLIFLRASKEQILNS